MNLSLIIPTYNRPKDIKRLLFNLNLQNRKPDEVIIVDASESDETGQMVEKSRENWLYPVSYYRHEKGLTRQRNFGISKAKHEIVGFTDDDSLFQPDYLERVLDIFEKDTERKIGGAAGFIIDVPYSVITPIDELIKGITSKEEFSHLMKKHIPGPITSSSRNMRKKIEIKLFGSPDEEEGIYCSRTGRLYRITKLFQGIKEVDFLRGIVFYRNEVYDHEKFSEFFDGYGFAEDAHFSLLVGKRYKLVVDGEALSYHMHAPTGRPDVFKVGYMSSRNLFYIFKTYRRRTLREYLLFWYFYMMEAVLEFLPAVLGRNSVMRTKLFMGKLMGVFRMNERHKDYVRDVII